MKRITLKTLLFGTAALGLILPLLAPCSVSAQSSEPGVVSWTVQDENGTPIFMNNDGTGSYSLFGTMSGTAANTYPDLMNKAAKSDPNQNYWYSAYAPEPDPHTGYYGAFSSFLSL